jgi:hypothetical protein
VLARPRQASTVSVGWAHGDAMVASSEQRPGGAAAAMPETSSRGGAAAGDAGKQRPGQSAAAETGRGERWSAKKRLTGPWTGHGDRAQRSMEVSVLCGGGERSPCQDKGEIVWRRRPERAYIFFTGGGLWDQ